MDEARLAVNKTEAAKALGVSVDFFDDHLQDELPCVIRGRRRLYPIRELERWLERSAERVGRVRASRMREGVRALAPQLLAMHGLLAEHLVRRLLG